MVGGLNGHFRTLGDTWADLKSSEFEDTLRDLEAFLKRFDAKAIEQVRWLRRKVQESRDYLGN